MSSWELAPLKSLRLGAVGSGFLVWIQQLHDVLPVLNFFAVELTGSLKLFLRVFLPSEPGIRHAQIIVGFAQRRIGDRRCLKQIACRLVLFSLKRNPAKSGQRPGMFRIPLEDSAKVLRRIVQIVFVEIKQTKTEVRLALDRLKLNGLFKLPAGFRYLLQRPEHEAERIVAARVLSTQLYITLK